jgi:hypothetical protein
MNNYRSMISATTVALIAPALALCTVIASAAPKTAVQAIAENGFYFRADGLYEQVKLPAYGLGIHNTPLVAPYIDLGPSQTFNQRHDGGGARGALGYGIPGTETRVELGGSYTSASDSPPQTTRITSSGPNITALLLTGAGVNSGFTCGAGLSCPTTGVLNTRYSAWQFNGKVETDWRYRSLTLTPSFSVFGGNTRADQTLAQTFTITTGGGVEVERATYSASTKLHWRDFGARAGLNLSSAVTPALTVGIGGSIAGAARHVSLSGNDSSNSTDPANFIVGSSSLSLSDSRTVLLANLEANAVYRLSPMTALRGFVGLNYDGDVPGIAAPFYTGSVSAPTSRNAASIVYASQTNYYAGGGLVVKFSGGPR